MNKDEIIQQIAAQKIALEKNQEKIRNQISLKKHRKRSKIAQKTHEKREIKLHEYLDDKSIFTPRHIQFRNEDKKILSKLEIDKERIKIALTNNYGNVTKASIDLNVDSAVLFRKIVSDKELSGHMDMVEQSLTDLAIDVIRAKLEEGNERVAMFILETKGKDRGYNKKIIKEVTGKDGAAIEINNTIQEKLKIANKVFSSTIEKII
jgi:hypothetical protein